MIQLNLLPDIKKEYLKAQKTKALVITSAILVTIGAIGLSALLFVYVTFVQQLQITLATDDIKNKTNEINQVQDLSKYLTIQNQLAALPQLHDQKGTYSRLFSFLPVLNPNAPNNIKLSNLTVSTTDKTILFTGNAANFQSLNVFVDTLSNAEVTYNAPDSDQQTTEKMFEAVVVQTSSLARVNNAEVVSFTVQVTYKDSVFDTKNTNVVPKVPSIQTTQSIVDSPKPQLFENAKPEGQ